MALYNAHAFDPQNLDHARAIILSSEGEYTTDRRWETETPMLVEMIREHLAPISASVILDYGCGIGRISREIIREFDSTLLGVDLSRDMLAIAQDYIGADDRFVPFLPHELLDVRDLDAAIAVWSLQHVKYLHEDVERIHTCLKPKGRLFLVNTEERCLPTNEGWATDGIRIRDILTERFTPILEGRLDSAVVGKHISENTFWAVYEKHEL